MRPTPGARNEPFVIREAMPTRVAKAGQVRSPEVGLQQGKWYNWGMNDFGKGPTLEQATPWLRDEAERIERILDVTERNSVIEGLPPLSEETRERLRKELTAGPELARAPGE